MTLLLLLRNVAPGASFMDYLDFKGKPIVAIMQQVHRVVAQMYIFFCG